MRLTLIGASNLKAQDFVQELTGLDALVGQNGAGKTSRIDALRLLLLGYVPVRDTRSAGSTFATLARDPEQPIEVWAEWTEAVVDPGHEDGSVVAGTVTRTVRRIVEPGKQHLVIDGLKVKSLKDGQAKLAELLGDQITVLDLGKALGGSDAERRAWLLELFPVAEPKLPEALAYDGAPTNLDALKADVASHVTDARARLRSAEHAHEVATAQARSTPDPPDLSALETELAKLRQVQEQRTKLEGSIEVLDLEVQGFQAPEGPTEEPATEVPAPSRSSTQLDQDAVTRRQQVDAAQEVLKEAKEAKKAQHERQELLKVVERREDGFKAALKDLGWSDELGPALRKLWIKKNELNATYTPLKQTLLYAEKQNEVKHACPMAEQVICPVDWVRKHPELKRQVDVLEGALVPIEDALVDGEAWKNAYDAVPTEVEVPDLSPLVEEVEHLRAELSDLRQEAADVRQAEQRRQAWLDAADERARQAATLEQLGTARRALAGLSEVDVPAVEVRLEVGRERANRRTYVTDQLQTADTDLTRARATYERWTARRDVVGDLERAALGQASDLEVVDLGKLEVDAEQARITVAGRSFDALSGGEQVLALVTLAQASMRGPLRVLAVEAGELHPDRLASLLGHLGRRYEAGELDHVLVCRPEGPSVAPKGWTVHPLKEAS